MIYFTEKMLHNPVENNYYEGAAPCKTRADHANIEQGVSTPGLRGSRRVKWQIPERK